MSLQTKRLVSTVPEVRQPVECQVSGKLPSWLNGMLLRNGPGRFEVGDGKYNHVFDGLAYLQKYEFKDGKVLFTGKFLRSDTYKTNLEANKIVVPEFGTARHADERKGFLKRYLSYLLPHPQTDNAAVNLVTLGDHVYAATETPGYHRIDTHSLESVEKVIISADVSPKTITAHPHYDSDGNMINMCLTSRTYAVVKTPAPTAKNSSPMGQLTPLFHFARRSILHPSYFHSFGMSEHYALQFETPLTIDLKGLLIGFLNNAVMHCMQWDKTLQTRILIGPLTPTTATPSREYVADGLFAFHHVNTYEVRNDNNCAFLVADYIGINDPLNMIQNLLVDKIRNGSFVDLGLLQRMIIPLDVPVDSKPGDDLLLKFPSETSCRAILRDDGSVFCTQELLIKSDTVEAPRINYERNNAKPYRFCYLSTVFVPSTDGILKADVGAKSFVSWKKAAWECPMEPIFIQKPDADDEDDGVIVAPVVVLKDGERPFLLVLDARTMEEIARASIPSEIPIHFHGIYVANKL